LNRPWSRRDRPVPRLVVQPLQAFLSTEAAAGVVVLCAAVVALVWANSPAAASYEALWAIEVGVDAGGLRIAEPLRAWVNDLLMAGFFFVIGLEVKREFVHGALRDPRTAALPIVCAAGGMAAPALLYLAINAGGDGAAGWGIPLATDIAFALGVLALLGERVPPGLKVFLLTLAVVDDIGAILVIAVFYSDSIALGWLGLAATALAAIVVAQRVGIRTFPFYVTAAAVVWLGVFESGVHATVAGVALGLLTPAWPFQPPETVASDARDHLDRLCRRPADGVADEDEQATLLHVSALVGESVSPLERLERALHPWTSYLVLPLFALANAGVTLDPAGLGAAAREPVTLGVIVGLVLGKPLGVLGAAALARAARVASLPDDVGWAHLAGVGMLAGIGFTVSLFIAGLAFPPGDLDDAARLGILIASLLAGAAGAAMLALTPADRVTGPSRQPR
jgi:NhaA family Na+:H+ antiporter